MASHLQEATHVRIVVAYVTKQGLDWVHQKIPHTAIVQLVLGKYQDGIEGKAAQFLLNAPANWEVRGYEPQFHAKIYDLTTRHSRVVYAGSSNLTMNGLSKGLEVNFEFDYMDALEVLNTIDEIWENSRPLKMLNFRTRRMVGSEGQPNPGFVALLESEHPLSTNFKVMRIDLIESLHPKSGLNYQFAKGRENKATGTISPREEGEAEIKISAELSAYMRDNFIAHEGKSGFTNPIFGARFGTETFLLRATSAKLKGSLDFRNLRSSPKTTLLGVAIRSQLLGLPLDAFIDSASLARAGGTTLVLTPSEETLRYEGRPIPVFVATLE